MRITRGARVLAIASMVALGMAACETDGNGVDVGAEDQEFVDSFTFGTGGTAGVYFPLGTEYANLLEENIEGISVNAIETDASVDNLGRIYQGEMQLGMTQNDTAQEAVQGTGQFEELGTPIDNVGWLGQLYPEAAQVITLEGAGYESIDDLEGQRIAIGAPGSGTRAVAEAILSAHGIEEGDYRAFGEDFADARALLQDGNLDASIEILGVPAASLSELAATQDVRLLPIEESIAEEIAAETAFDAYTIPADAYDFVEEDLTTLSVFAGVVASTTQVSPEHGYEITRVLYEHADEISLAQGDLIDVEEALVGQGDLPLHPGAEQYFREQGILE
jgi:uncharacterized protein